jgi:hypothetical protein
MLRERRLDAAKSLVVTERRNESVKRKNKSGLFTGRSCKEAKEEGKSLRKGDARCRLGLRQDTRIEEVSILGRGLKSCLVLRASLFAIHISNSETKESSPRMWNTRNEFKTFIL